MRLALAVALLVSSLVGCGNEDGPRSVSGATLPALYTATLSASSSCANQLPAELAVRVYEVRLFSSGQLQWSGPTVTQPQGHQQMSRLTVDGNSVSLVIGIQPQDPQSDDFHGIWEDLGGNREFIISGRGSGRVEGSAMSGTFEGYFHYWVVNGTSTGCNAVDHRFTLVPR